MCSSVSYKLAYFSRKESSTQTISSLRVRSVLQWVPPLTLTCAGEILEIGAFWSIRTQDVPSFDRYFSQLQAFYTDYACVLPHAWH